MDEDEDAIIYGTPLPALGDNENATKKQELDLTVRDWKGRRRFHGAFTGGFSAGYFNTVGTEKGWVPSQFVSKKNEKWDKNLIKNRPEDYMDEEDFSMFGIAPKKVHTKDKFKGPEMELFAGFRDPNATMVDVLRDIIKPSRQSVGVRLFQAMKKGKRYKGAVIINNKAKRKVYSCEMPSNFSTSKDFSVDDEEEDDSSLKPESFSLPYTPKTDLHGIGHKPLQSGLTSDKNEAAPLTALLSGNKRLKISGEAFGYGALEDEDDDYADEAQIYSREDLSKYDFEIGTVNKKEAIKPSSSYQSSQNCILDDFVRAETTKPFKSTVSNLPVIPKNWKPTPPFLTSKIKVSRWDSKSSGKENQTFPETGMETTSSSTTSTFPTKPTTTDKPDRPPTLNANVRVVLLGEEVDIVMGMKKQPEELAKSTSITPDQKNTINEQPSTSRSLNAYFASKFVRSSEILNESLAPGLTDSRTIISPQEKVKPIEEETKSCIGQVKRETFQWHPHSLLCKRFNVPHPYPQYPDVVGVLGATQDKTAFASKKNFADTKPNLFSSLFEPQVQFSPKCSTDIEERPPRADSARGIVRKTQDTEEESQEIIETIEERPPMDLFKAIFASDEESDEEEKEKEQSSQEKPQDANEEDKSQTIGTRGLEKGDPQNSSNNKPEGPPKKLSSVKGGIFSGIDLDLLNKTISHKLDPIILDQGEESAPQHPTQDMEIEDTYGPALPPPDLSLPQTSHDSDDGNRKKAKKKKKSKDKKHKSKKSKKKRRRKSSSSDADESEDDVDAKIIKLIRDHRT